MTATRTVIATRSPDHATLVPHAFPAHPARDPGSSAEQMNGLPVDFFNRLGHYTNHPPLFPLDSARSRFQIRGIRGVYRQPFCPLGVKTGILQGRSHLREGH